MVKKCQSRECDAVAIGTPFIANANLVEKLKKDLPLTEPKFDLFYSAGEEGYTNY